MPTTEIAIIPLHPGTAIGDPDTEAAQIIKECADTITRQPGCQEINFGPTIESPDVLQMLISKTLPSAPLLIMLELTELQDWDTRQSHADFEASSEYPPFMKAFGKIIAGGAQLIHVDFQPASALTKALSAPVTEIATFYHNGAPSDSYVEDALKIEPVLAKADGYLGAALGVTYEEVEREGVKGKAAVLVVGWQSKEAHMAFRETESFRENIGMLRGEAKGIEMHHVALMKAL